MTKEMKDSGVEWIGEIPEDWEMVRLKDKYVFEKGKNAGLYTKEYVGSNIGNYPVYSGQTENRGVMGYIDSYEYDLKNSIYTTTVGAKVMTANMIFGKISLSQNCVLFINRDENTDDRFVLYFLNPLFKYEKSMIPSYMQPSLRIEDLKRYIMFTPNIYKQKSIADFLDKKTLEIDNIISKTKKAILEYKKYKQSLITETVTKGLDKNIPMKDSGIEWIGDIPGHWEIRQLKYIFNIKKDIAKELGYDVLSITQKGLKVRDLSSNEGQLSMDYSKYQIVNKNDFAMNHMDLLTGWVDLSKTLGVTSPDYRVFNIKVVDEYSNNYYLKLLQLCYTNRIFYGSGQGVSNLGRWRLQTEAFNNIYYPVPPLKEQQQIANYLDEKCTQIDNIISTKQKLLIEMEQYKKSLIYETVTGKREVE